MGWAARRAAGTSTAPGWGFASYTQTTSITEDAVDSTTAATASAGVSDTTVVTGAGASGVSVDTASGWYSWSGNSILPARNYSYAQTSTTAVTLAGPTLPPFWSAPTNWMLGPGTGAWTPPSDLTAIAAKLATATPFGAPGGVVTPGVLGETAYGLNLPPLLQGVAGPAQPGGFTAPNTATPAYGYGLAFGRSVWLGLQGPGMSPLLTANTGQHPWSWLSQFQPALWSKVNRAFTDGLARARAGGSPSALCSQLAFQATVARTGATVTLPDFQGVGIGNAVSDAIASMWRGLGYRPTSTTTHPAMIESRRRSNHWKIHRAPSFAAGAEGGMKHATTRLTASFTYVGPPMNRIQARMLLGK